MKNRISDYPLVIIGAGAAGIGASEYAEKIGIQHIVLEASHRAGGRGLTEYLEGSIPVDLGCHWMHCASINPYVKLADKLGFNYLKIDRYDYAMFFRGSWLGQERRSQYATYLENSCERVEQMYMRSPSAAIYDALDTDSEWSDIMFYWWSLMHSNDVDEIAVQDYVEFKDTGEDWPVREGYGALIARQSEDRPITFNSKVTNINWGKTPIELEANNGMLRADKVILTVSTGVLSSGQICFVPSLPEAKQTAINALPLGNSNYQFFSLEPGTIDRDTPENISYYNGEVSMSIRTFPFGTPCIFSCTGGRFAWWLEKQGPQVSRVYFEDALVDIFGSKVKQGLREFKVSAWGFDPLIQGAYSSQRPGLQDMRPKLASALNDCLYFAGEAASSDFLNTVQGAYLSGIQAVADAYGICHIP